MHAERYEGVEVAGSVVLGFIDGFKAFKFMASEYLLAEGLGTGGADGSVVIDPSAWYPFDAYLRAFERAQREVGESAVMQVGFGAMQQVYWQPHVTSLETLVRWIDFGYHLHHRKHGRVMADAKTGTVLEGIGHYRGRKLSETSFEIECENPYPCPFDLGLVQGAVRRLGLNQVTLVVTHDDARPCRQRGGASCTLQIKSLG